MSSAETPPDPDKPEPIFTRWHALALIALLLTAIGTVWLAKHAPPRRNARRLSYLCEPSNSGKTSSTSNRISSMLSCQR